MCARPKRHIFFFVCLSNSIHPSSIECRSGVNVKLTDWKMLLINDSEWIMAYWLLGTAATEKNIHKQRCTQQAWCVRSFGRRRCCRLENSIKAKREGGNCVIRRFIYWWDHCLRNLYVQNVVQTASNGSHRHRSKYTMANLMQTTNRLMINMPEDNPHRMEKSICVHGVCLLYALRKLSRHARNGIIPKCLSY